MTMTILHTMPNISAQPTWMRVLLGVVMILGGILVLGDVVLATIISAKLIGLTAIVVGVVEIIHAFATKGWGSFVWKVLLGVLYVAAGTALLRAPVAGALMLTWIFGVFLLASGFVRIIMGFGQQESGWTMLISGTFGIIAGLIILTGFPATGLWVLGFLLGIDLILHGIAWLVFGRARPVHGT